VNGVSVGEILGSIPGKALSGLLSSMGRQDGL